MELNYAFDLKLPIFCYVVDDDYPWVPKHIDADPARSKLTAFKGRVGNHHVRDTFTTADDLAFKVASALGRFLTTQKIKEELSRATTVQLPLLGHRDQVARRAARLADVIRGSKLMIINDRPDEMRGPMRIFEELQIDVEVAESTSNAMSWLNRKNFDVVVSDMARGAEQDAGLKLLKEMQSNGFKVPVIFTVGRFKPEMGTPAHAFGITNRVDDLLNLVFDALERARG
jgi:PleD family two-component response regulator